MIDKRIFTAACLVLLGVGAGLAWRQYAETSRLRAEIAAHAVVTADLERLRAEHARLAQERPPAAELEKLRDDHAAIVRLKGELDALKSAPAEATAEPAAPDEAGPPPKAESLLASAATWKNAGRATPRAAFETALWAAAGGDVDALAQTLALEPAARDAASALLASLPAAQRSSYATPERLVSLLAAREMGFDAMRVLAQTKSPAGDTVLGVVLMSENKTRGANLTLRQAADGWQLVVPRSAVEKYSAQLRGVAPTAAPK